MHPKCQSAITKQTLNVAGLVVNVFVQPDAAAPTAPVAVLFLLHGRMGSAEGVEPVARAILDEVHARRVASAGQQADDLVVVTFIGRGVDGIKDQRNHGTRLVDAHANWHWEADTASEKHNVRHALDMYAIQTGTARDVSFLIDFLPAYLYPNDERTVSQWLVSGISLGGHATWIVLKDEPRVKLGIPIIGCPDFLTLISARAAEHNLALAPPHFPAPLLAYVRARDPAATPHTAGAPAGANPFRGKKVLVLCGAADALVPWKASERFVGELDVGEGEGGEGEGGKEGGVKEVWVEEGVGHRCSEGMVRRVGEFLWREALVR
ncbi:Alpha/Beta hydrolase protein [Lenzites betulinus]|nr:Alpha/Beta hydrolase protein [Lenzites betulinus]